MVNRAINGAIESAASRPGNGVANQLARGSGGTEAIERPDILTFIVAENVIISVVCANPKIAGIGRVPAAIELVDLKFAASENEAKGSFIGAIPGITLNAHLAHNASF